MNRPFGLPGNGPVKRYEQREALGWLPRGWIDGLALSNDGTDATNDIAISAGVCRSTVNVVEGEASTLTRDQLDIEIPTSIIKQLDVSFAPENYDPDGYSGGGRSGMLSPLSVIANSTWHIYAVGGGGCQDDVIAIDSATQATVLAALQAAGGFTAYRRIGSIIRLSAAIMLFSQVGDYFRIKTPVMDVSTTTLTTTSSTFTLTTVPTGINARVDLGLSFTHASGANVYIRHPDDTDNPGSASAAPVCVIGNGGASISGLGGFVSVMCNTSAQIAARASAASTALRGAPYGWLDPRGRNS